MLGFNNLSLAKSFLERTIKLHLIILGDDNKFWVVTPTEGERLIKLGYEYAN